MSKKSILLVDDEKSIRLSIGWALEKNNFEVTTATDGQEAIQQLKLHCYDLVITDLKMGKINGLTVLQEAKSLYPDIGVIVLTGYADLGSAIESLRMGADDYLQKPCDTDELITRSRRSFEKQDMLVKLRKQNEQLKDEISMRKAIERELEKAQANLEQEVEVRTAELSVTVDRLETALQTVVLREKEVLEKNTELNDTNVALNILLKRRESEHGEIRNEIAQKTIDMILPLLKKAQKNATGSTRSYLETAQTNLLDIFSAQPHDALLTNAKLAPRELQVINYIRQGKSSKEIADLLNLTVSTITSYRENIREKLGLKNKKINLNRFLTSHH